MTSDDPAQDLTRTQAALVALSGLKTDQGFVTKFPLPFPPETFIELMLPQVKQI